MRLQVLWIGDAKVVRDEDLAEGDKRMSAHLGHRWGKQSRLPIIVFKYPVIIYLIEPRKKEFLRVFSRIIHFLGCSYCSFKCHVYHPLFLRMFAVACAFPSLRQKSRLCISGCVFDRCMLTHISNRMRCLRDRP